MDQVDSYIQTSIREVDKPFLLPIEDFFIITGRSTVVTGRVNRQKIRFNYQKKIVVTGIEMFNKPLDFTKLLIVLVSSL